MSDDENSKSSGADQFRAMVKERRGKGISFPEFVKQRREQGSSVSWPEHIASLKGSGIPFDEHIKKKRKSGEDAKAGASDPQSQNGAPPPVKIKTLREKLLSVHHNRTDEDIEQHRRRVKKQDAANEHTMQHALRSQMDIDHKPHTPPKGRGMSR